MSKEMFGGDELATNVWKTKYATEDETHYNQMHERMAKEFSRIESNYQITEPLKNSSLKTHKDKLNKLSDYGAKRERLTNDSIYNFFKDFKYIIPQGSIMSTLGTNQIASLSNCWVVHPPLDSYPGILKTDGDLVYYYKRRGGVGVDISNLRPNSTPTNNAAKTTTGAISFMERFSNTTREVAMNGRRGALMISINVNHPDVLLFAKIKSDKTKVTGANISIKLTDEFMKAVINNEDYVLRFPCNTHYYNGKENYQGSLGDISNFEYDELYEVDEGVYIKRIKAKEYWDEFIKQARDNAEPGLMYWDNILDYDPAAVYEQYKPVTSNPCFHPDTLIETEYGRIKIKNIDKPMRVYSMDSDGRLVMSNASASFISKKNAKTLKITLKNGSNIQVTPEHRLWVQDIGWVEAKDLKVGEHLGHLCRSRRGAKYAGVHLTTSPNKRKDQIMEHKLVYGQHEANMNVHHIDRNTYNNSVDNLELLSHSEHSRITALEDNPQTHQEKDESGKFISGENSKHGKKTIVNLPKELKTNMLSKYHNMISSIEEGEITDVYDIQVEDTHCLIANNIIAHNCGEQFLQPGDSCRLMVHNLMSYVVNPFKSDAYFDEKLFYKNVYEGTRLGDDLVDLEAEYIQRIIDKIISDPEPDKIKQNELDLWVESKRICLEGRRVGMGITALGDTIAALGYKYDSDEALLFIEQMMYRKMEAELDCSIDLAILRGKFKGFDTNMEYANENNEKIGKNSFYQFVKTHFPSQYERMVNNGRRNISWSTIAPTGSVSILTNNCTSGCEPLFSAFYMRRKKINQNDKTSVVHFVDGVGDKWLEFPVIHPYFKQWIQSQDEWVNSDKYPIVENLTSQELTTWLEKSPYYKSTSSDINWNKRVEIQAILQKYTTNAISSTINLPSTVTYDEVGEIYMKGWVNKLKGQTVYVDGSRDGVLVNTETKKNREEFSYVDAVKRPKSLDGDAHVINIKGVPYNVVIGLNNNKPYEIFIDNTEKDLKGKGLIIKKGKGQYYFKQNDVTLDISSNMTEEQTAITRLVSTSLRHGADIKFIVEQLNKSDGDLFSFTKALSRVLKKYIPDGVKSSVTCQDCGGSNVIFQEGCQTCQDCGSSKCG